MSYILLTPLTFCLVIPQYLILSTNHNFTKYLHGAVSTNLFWPTAGILIGIFVSVLLLKYVLGTFILLSLGAVIFTLSCLGLFLCSMLHIPITITATKYILTISGFGIGMTQPNIAALFGDQFHTSSIQHFYLYVLIQMIGIGLAVGVPLIFKIYSPEDCLLMNCFSFIYFLCLVSSALGCVLLIPVYYVRMIFVVRPLTFVHQTSDNNSNLSRLQIFTSINLPLIILFLVSILLERELWSQAKQMNRVVLNFFLQEIHLYVIFSCMPILCVPLAMLFALRHSNGFVKITISGIFISLASLYLEEINSYLYATDTSSNYKPYVVPRNLIAYQVYNGINDATFHFKEGNLTKVVPFQEKIGPIRVKANNTNITVSIQDLGSDNPFDSEDFILTLTLAERGKLVSFWLTEDGALPWVEKPKRPPNGLVYILLFYRTADNVCLVSKTYRKCIKTDSKAVIVLLEIPPGSYTFTSGKLTIGKYFLDYGAYYTIIYSNRDSDQESMISTFLIIPPYSLGIIWHLAIYVLMSMAKVMIYAGGLDVAYLIATDDQKSLFISCLYSFYLIAFISNIIIIDVFKYRFHTSLDIITFLAVLSTVAIYSGHRYFSHLLNRKE